MKEAHELIVNRGQPMMQLSWARVSSNKGPESGNPLKQKRPSYWDRNQLQGLLTSHKLNESIKNLYTVR